MKTNLFRLCVVVLSAAVILGGCGKKSPGSGTVDETAPLSEIRAMAENMDMEGLKKMAEKYKDAIVSKQGELDQIMEKLKEIPLTEKLSTEAKALQEELTTAAASVSALTERLNVYLEYIKAKGGEITGLMVE